MIEIIIDLAMRLYSLPYRWGGSNPMTGFDCSGFIVELFKSVGWLTKSEDLNAQGLYQLLKRSKALEINDRGSLAFYGPSIDKINHVALCITSELCIEAGAGDSKTTTLDQAIKQNAFIRVRRTLQRQDFLIALSLKDFKR